MTVEIWADGLCEPVNPGGYACYGWIAKQDGEQVADGCGCIGHGPWATNNIAEYWSVSVALSWAIKAGLRGVTVYSDSQLVVEQVAGRWQCRSPHLLKLRDAVRNQLRQVAGRLQWVARDCNAEADALSRKAYAEARPTVQTHTQGDDTMGFTIAQRRFELLPVGQYRARIAAIEEVEGQFGDQCKFTFELLGEHEGRALTGYTSQAFSPRSKLYAWTRAVFGGNEIDPAYLWNSDDLIGREVDLVLTTATGADGGEFNRIDSLRPIRKAQPAQPVMSKRIEEPPAWLEREGEELPF